MKERNVLIANTFIRKREEYGKTLIFAINGVHCISLCEELQQRGIKCDYIYSAHEGNEEKVRAFKEGDLDVLVNINILTEGSDIPNIQTVFLTRPTSSDVLLMQMIGRGMRGVGCGGTETVNIVDFHDNWGSMTYWLNPRFLFEMETESADLPDQPPRPHTDSQMVPWEMLRDLLEGIDSKMIKPFPTASTVLPIGWYDIVDEDGNDGKVMVFDDQVPGYLDLWRNREKYLLAKNIDSQLLLEKYFGGFGLQPSTSDLQLVLETYRLEGEMPHLHQFTERRQVDAYMMAEELKNKNVGINDISVEIDNQYEQHAEIINSVYGSLEGYRQRVMDYLLYPKGIKPQGCRIEEFPEETMNLDRTPCYDLAELTKEVVNEMFNGDYGELPDVSWTNKAYKGYFGMYRYAQDKRKQKPSIVINQLLNSKDVPRQTVKYIIYHELLHRDYRNHGSAFRMQERKFPDWTEHERFLDVTFPMFDLLYAV